MKYFYNLLRQGFPYFVLFVLCSLVFVPIAPAPPLPPPPPTAPAGGDFAQAVAIGTIAVYGTWRAWRR